MRNIKWLTLILVVLVVSILEVVSAQIAVPKRRSPRTQRTSKLMRSAREAKISGNTAKATLLWQQAQVLKPGLARPKWLDKKPSLVSEKAPVSEKETLTKISALPYLQAKVLLDKLLYKSPGNFAVRQLYLELALKNNDSTQISRHRSILFKPVVTSWFFYAKYAVAILIVLFLLGWQGREMYRDILKQ